VTSNTTGLRANAGRQSLFVHPWRVDVVRRPGLKRTVAGAEIARAVARALEAARAPEPGSVTVVLTDDEELGELNREHMGHDGPTDVLSFPMLEPDAFRRTGPDDAQPQRRSSRAPARHRPRTHLGDIAISVERAIEQAEGGRGGHTGDVRWSPADELRLLVTHGTLHLCGWDHAEPAEEAAMRALENALLDRR
jgi:probable rRNA maturation factor